jgi:hypothetical protein
MISSEKSSAGCLEGLEGDGVSEVPQEVNVAALDVVSLAVIDVFKSQLAIRLVARVRGMAN